MTDRIKGITVEIGGDTTALSKALKEVNKSIKDTQKDLNDVEKLLKLDPKNTELLAQKHDLLAKNIENAKTKLDALKQAEAQLESDGVEKNSEQWQEVQREIIKANNELDGFQGKLKQLNDSKLQAPFDALSKGADKVAKSFGPISAGAGALAGGLLAAGYSAVTASDDLNTLAKQTGLSTETLQEAKLAADLIDVSFETFTGSIAKMTAKLRTNEKGFTELGIATRDANGNLLGTEEIFWNTAQTLSEMTNETERDIAAQELFGKSAAELAGILDDGGRAFREIGEEAKASGQIMSQETLDGLNAVNDQIDKLKASAGATLAVAGAKAIEALTPVITVLADKLAEVLNWVAQLDEKTISTILTVLGVVTAITPVATAISSVSGAISTLIPIITKVVGLLGGPVTIAITAVIAIIILLVKHWDEVKEAITKFVDSAKEKLEQFKSDALAKIGAVADFLKNLPKNALQWGKDLIQNFINGIMEKWEALKQKVSDVAETVKDFLGFSEPKKGPLSNFHTFAPDMMKLYAQGIRDNMYLVTDQMNQLAQNMSMTMNRTANLTVTAPVYLDGSIIATAVNERLGVML